MKKKLFLMVLSGFMLLQSSSVLGEVLRPDASTFPNRTIIIGSYAIVIDRMTSNLLEKAEASAQMENQSRIYYKSDINAGTWYDITESNDISEISKTVDNVVSYNKINSLNLTYYINEKGEIIDLTKGEQVNDSEIGDVAFVENMPELRGIEKEREIQKVLKEQGDKEGTECYKSLERVLKDLYSEEEDFVKQLKEFDKQIYAIENGIAELQSENADLEVINEITNQKTAIENKRKLLCYQKELERLEKEMTELNYNTNSDLIAKYAEYVTNIQMTIPTLEEVKQTETSSQLQKMLLEQQEAFQKAIGEEDKNTSDIALQKILAIQSAMLGEEAKTEQQRQQQKEILEQAKQQAEQNIQELSKNGCQGEEYQKAAENGEPESVLQQKEVEGLLILNVALDDVAVCLEQMAKITEEKEMIALYEQSIQNIENAFEQFNENSSVAETAKNALQQSKNDFQNKKNVLQLNGMEEYNIAKEQREQAKQQAEQKQQQYLSAAEQGQTELLESTKQQMNEAIDDMEQAEQRMREIEQQIQQNNERQNIENDELQQNQSIENTDNESQQSQDAENTNSTPQQNETTQNVQTEREDNYTPEQKQEIQQKIEQLQQQHQQTFFAPWTVIFQDYDVKLLSPIWQTEKEIYIPAQEFVRQIGVSVYKSKTDSEYVLKGNGAVIQYYLGENTIYVNGEEMEIDPPPTVYGNRVYLPLSVFEKAYHMEHIKLQNNDIIVYRI